MSDALLDQLGGLAEPPPVNILDRVVDGWLRAPGPEAFGDDVLVAVTSDGVGFLRDAAEGEDAFLEAYRDRFGRPLRPIERAPRGLLPALRGDRGRPTLDLSAGSDFDRAVLTATASIPNGETRPYSWVAREAGRPTAVRAAASVLARNPVPLLVPCHRVVRADGRLGRYMFGPSTKTALLRGEGADLDALADLSAQGVALVGSDTTGVVCYPSCHHARRITPNHRHGFASLAAATEAGYRPCEHCRP